MRCEVKQTADGKTEVFDHQLGRPLCCCEDALDAHLICSSLNGVSGYATLLQAILDLYLAGKWTCDEIPAGRQQILWLNLRDAAKISEGTASRAGGGSMSEECKHPKLWAEWRPKGEPYSPYPGTTKVDVEMYGVQCEDCHKKFALDKPLSDRERTEGGYKRENVDFSKEIEQPEGAAA